MRATECLILPIRVESPKSPALLNSFFTQTRQTYSAKARSTTVSNTKDQHIIINPPPFVIFLIITLSRAGHAQDGEMMEQNAGSGGPREWTARRSFSRYDFEEPYEGEVCVCVWECVSGGNRIA